MRQKHKEVLALETHLGAELHRRSTELTKLARLRREQGYDIDEILAELEILGEILFNALKEEAQSFGRKVPPGYAIEVSERLYRALTVITAITAATFSEEGFRDRRERARLLGGFGLDLAHELRNTMQRIKGVADGTGLARED